MDQTVDCVPNDKVKTLEEEKDTSFHSEDKESQSKLVSWEHRENTGLLVICA